MALSSLGIFSARTSRGEYTLARRFVWVNQWDEHTGSGRASRNVLGWVGCIIGTFGYLEVHKDSKYEDE